MKIKLLKVSPHNMGNDIRVIAVAALLLAGNWNEATAQKRADQATSSRTSVTTISGIDDLPGIDPSADICTTNMPQDDNSKIFCFYNEGAKRFMNVGGIYGTHVSLNESPYAIWFEKSDSDEQYYLNNNITGSGAGHYIGIKAKPEIYMDASGKYQGKFIFTKANGYSETNKVYTISTKAAFNGKTYYVTAYPDNKDKYCNVETSLYSTSDSKYSNQVWKIISKEEYYKLFLANPANMASAIDATFMIKAPSFRVNDTEMTNWISYNNAETGKIFFGDKTQYCTYANRGGFGDKHFVGYGNGNHQMNYGKYFYCYTRGARNFHLYQDVKVHKAGWYILRCNGFSTANSNEVINDEEDKQPLAYLIVATVNKDGLEDRSTATASSLNGISQSEANTLEANDSGAGAGIAFFNGKYENQVQICVEKDAYGNPIDEDHPATIRIGFYVEKGKSTAVSNELTAVDNFRLLYAGPRRSPELILDEEQTNLKYLTLATDEYKNSILHISRTLNPHMWNSIILPVDLTAGQLKRTFGDGVKIAKLANLTEHSVQFTTEETDNDSKVILNAYTPYIIYPPVTKTYSPSYTAEKFYTKEGEDNSEWLGTDYEPSTDENNHLTITVPANHYDITMVSFDRNEFNKYVNTEKENWVSNTTFSADGTPGHMECLGTMAKTYDENGIIEGRDNLNGDYFMYKGKLIQVPSGKMENGEDYSYGLKGFRCWFELTDKDNAEDGSSTSKKFSLFIDGVEDNTTGIDDIHTFNSITSYKRGINGVFNMNGQMVRPTNSTDRLPKGLYVMNGKKIVIR